MGQARPSEYRELLTRGGYAAVGWYDGSHHLVHYFASMLRQIEKNRVAMLAEGAQMCVWRGAAAHMAPCKLICCVVRQGYPRRTFSSGRAR